MALTIEQLNELHSDSRRCAEMTGLVDVEAGRRPRSPTCATSSAARVRPRRWHTEHTFADYLARATPTLAKGLTRNERQLAAFLGALFDTEFSLLGTGELS